MKVRDGAAILMNLFDRPWDDPDATVCAKSTFEPGKVVDWKIVIMTDDEMYANGYDETDPEGMYLVLTMADGTEGWYRYSYIEFFQW